MTFENTEIKAEIVGLREDITRLQERIATPPNLRRPLASSPSLSSRRSRFSRFRAPFRRISSTSTRKSIKTDPGSSTEALVEPDGVRAPAPDQIRDKTAGDLLSLLAPLVTRLQALGKTIREKNDFNQEVNDEFKACCTDLESCIARFSAHSNSDPSVLTGEVDAHDIEMKALLLDALNRKVAAERDSLPTQSPPTSRSSSIVRSTSASPFVLHSSDLLGPGSRRASTPESGPRSIPIGTGPGSSGHLGPFPSFADAGQHTGLSNVFRLGSFQNSLLFSPSPVAVRQPSAIGGTRV